VDQLEQQDGHCHARARRVDHQEGHDGAELDLPEPGAVVSRDGDVLPGEPTFLAHVHSAFQALPDADRRKPGFRLFLIDWQNPFKNVR
jgi:hypothetical protein